MTMAPIAPASPSPTAEIKKSDPRIKRILAVMNAQGKRPDSLIQVLHATQELFGYLPKPIIEFIAKELRIPASRVYGVVTFYHFFSLKPQGEHSCVVCMGTACYVKGAHLLVEELEKEFGVKPGEVTKDNKLGVQIARCIGSCGMAPAVVVDGEVLARVKPEDLVPKVKAKMGVPA
jgi:bidirectional [NiFe] hydrogenase diaphorase subunit